AMSYLRTAEEAGRTGVPLRTYGGRLLRMQPGWGRFARNAVVQGAAAELFKAWAATVRAGLPEGAQIVLCLHDELLVHARRDDGDQGRIAGPVLRSMLAAWANVWRAIDASSRARACSVRLMASCRSTSTFVLCATASVCEEIASCRLAMSSCWWARSSCWCC